MDGAIRIASCALATTLKYITSPQRRVLWPHAASNQQLCTAGRCEECTATPALSNVQKLPSTRATPAIAYIHQCVPEPGSIQRTMIVMRQRSHVWVSTSGRERLGCLCRSVKWFTMPMPTQAITRRPESQCKQPSTQSNVNTSQHSSEPLRVTSQGASRHHRCAAGCRRNCSPRDARFHHRTQTPPRSAQHACTCACNVLTSNVPAPPLRSQASPSVIWGLGCGHMGTPHADGLICSHGAADAL